MKFDTYREAYAFWKANKDSVPNGMIMTIAVDGHTVRTRPVKEPEVKKRDRSQDSNHIFGVIKDDLGTKGVFNHADGKRYDSKSAFEKAVRSKGCRIVGNDWNNSKYQTPAERGVRGDFNVRPDLKIAVEKVIGT